MGNLVFHVYEHFKRCHTVSLNSDLNFPVTKISSSLTEDVLESSIGSESWHISLPIISLIFTWSGCSRGMVQPWSSFLASMRPCVLSPKLKGGNIL